MNFNRCSRCGCFYLSGSAVCPNCEPKEQMEINILKNYIEETGNNYGTCQMNDIISSTGISSKNLNRFLMQDQFSDFASQIQKTNLN